MIATGSGSGGAGPSSATTGGATTSTQNPRDPTLSHSRVKRHPKRSTKASQAYPHSSGIPAEADQPTSPPPSYASVTAGQSAQEREQAKQAKIAIIESILAEEDLYKLLGVKRNAKQDEIRRGFLSRSRSCHPDKFPNHAPATSAFQKVSFAYETLSKPSSRRLYDVSGRTDFAAAVNTAEGHSDSASGLGDDTLNGVLYSVFCEFMEGDFEMIRVLVNALNEGNPSMNLGDEAVDSIEGAFKRLRDILLAGKRYLSVIRFELIRLYEIQHSLRQLSYFNLTGRLKLTLQLARVTINIPLAIDQAMKQPAGPEPADGDHHSRDHADGHHALSSSDESESDEDQGKGRRSQNLRRATNGSATEEFGVAPEDDDRNGAGDSDSDSNERSEARAEETARARRRAARARRRAARRQRRGKLHGDDASESTSRPSASTQALQRKGILPASAVGLLRGVVKVLETSEAWVPGGAAAATAA